MVDKSFTNLAVADQHRRETLRGNPAVLPRARYSALKKRLRRQRGQGSLFRWFPDNAVAAHQSKRCVPCPHGDWEIEGRDNSGDAKRMPAFHHPMLAALGRDGNAVELARRPDSELP